MPDPEYEYRYVDADTGKEISPPAKNNSNNNALNPGVKKDASIIDALLNVNDFKNNLYHFLKNETYNQETMTWYRPEGVNPLLKDEALTEIWAVVNTLIDKHSATANITNDQLEGMTMLIGDEIQVFLSKNMKRFDLDDDKVNRIYKFLTVKIHLFLSMALNGNAFEKLVSTYSVMEQRSNQERTGFLSGLFQGKGGN